MAGIVKYLRIRRRRARILGLSALLIALAVGLLGWPDPALPRLPRRAVLPVSNGQRVDALAFSPDGWTLAIGCEDATVRLWDSATGREKAVLSGHSGRIYSLAFSPDGEALASGGTDAITRLWDVSTGRLVMTLRQRSSVDCIQFSSNGRVLASGNSYFQMAWLWDVATGKSKFKLHHPWGVHSLAFSPDGRTLATAGSAGRDGMVRLWDVATGKLKVTLRGLGGVNCLAFAPDGKTLAEARAGAFLGGPVRRGNVWLQDLATGRVRVIDVGRHLDRPSRLAFSPDGLSLAVSWDRVDDSRNFNNYPAPIPYVLRKIGVVSRIDRSFDVRLIGLGTGRVLAQLPDQVYPAFSPDGWVLTTANRSPNGRGAGVTLWDSPSGRLPGTANWGAGGVRPAESDYRRGVAR